MSKTAQKILVVQLIMVIDPPLEKKLLLPKNIMSLLEKYGPQFSIINLGNQKSSIAKLQD